ncbi:uncharacterized protein [Amphiura filiformis]|uniref:uncharacterized protein n=1 Tax=Amphiura filiformis TaxID=82378 RepID=UPI003B21C027
MSRWLKTFLILSVVAILNIVGFMYVSGYSFMIWGTPVEQKHIHANHRDEHRLNVQHHNLANILRRPAGEDPRKNSEGLGDVNNSRNDVFNPNQSGLAVAQTNLNTGGENHGANPQVGHQIEQAANEVVVKIQQPHDQQQQGQQQQQQGQQQQGLPEKQRKQQQQEVEISNVINPLLDVNLNQANQQLNLDNGIVKKLEQMKAEVAALQKSLQQNVIPEGNPGQQQQQQLQQELTDLHQQVVQQQQDPNMQIGPDQQNVNPALAHQNNQAVANQNNQAVANQNNQAVAHQNNQAVANQMFGPQLDPHLKNIDSAIIRNIISKANPPNTERVFPHDFQLTLNEPNTCDNPEGSTKDVFLVVLINSIHKNFEQRRAIRATWGSVTDVEGKKVVTLFTLAKNSDKKLNELVQQESEQYHDLLLEEFIDTYKNLTYKTIMGLKWAAVYCPKANYVMKTDDDMYINYDSLVKYLKSPKTPDQNHVAGFVINGSPIRDPKSKWYMPRNLYPGNKYPPFCSGTVYVMSGDVALKVYAISEYTPFLYLEDVYVAICLEKLHIVPVKHKEFNNWRTAYSYCRFKRIISTHMVTPTEMNRIWKDQHSNKGYHC